MKDSAGERRSRRGGGRRSTPSEEASGAADASLPLVPEDEGRPADPPKALAKITEGRDRVLLPEIVEVIRQEGSRVDVNVLVVQLVNQAADPAELILKSEEILALAQKFEDHRVANFQRLADAIIEVKTRDPDEIEKRRNNRIRRALKTVVGSCAVASLGAAIVTVWIGAGIVATGLFVTMGALSLAMAGPLASGESMSSRDVVRIIDAIRGMWPERGAGEGSQGEREGQRDQAQPEPLRRR